MIYKRDKHVNIYSLSEMLKPGYAWTIAEKGFVAYTHVWLFRSSSCFFFWRPLTIRSISLSVLSHPDRESTNMYFRASSVPWCVWVKHESSWFRCQSKSVFSVSYVKYIIYPTSDMFKRTEQQRYCIYSTSQKLGNTYSFKGIFFTMFYIVE